MASNLKTLFLEDFTGGMNDALPPDMLAENQLQEVTNFVPLEGSTQLVLRRGIDKGAIDFGGEIRSLFFKKKTSGDTIVYASVVNGDDLVVKALDGTTLTTVHTFTSTQAEKVWFCNWDGNRLFFSDGYGGLWTLEAGGTAERVTNNQMHTDIYPDSDGLAIADAHGTIASGTAADLNDSDTVSVVINEEAETPGFDVRMTFTIPAGSSIDPHVKVYGRYAGSTQHNITVQAYNNTTSAWTTLSGTIPNQAAPALTIHSGLTSDHIHSTTRKVIIRFNHTMNGIATHTWTVGWVELMNTGEWAPSIENIVQHNGRLWGSKGNIVYFCGTDDDTLGEGYPRWRNWTPLVKSAEYVGTTWETRAEVSYDDGSSMMIPPYGTNVTALRSTANGLLVFKERSISVWTYPDAAAPFEVTEGAAITTLVSSVGCVDDDSLAQDGDTIYFIGNDDADRWSLYRFADSQVEDVGFNLKNRWTAYKGSRIVAGAILGKRYYVFGDAGMEMMYDISLGAWFQMDSTRPGVSFVSVARGFGQGYISLGGDDGRVWQYPSTLFVDNGNMDIPFSLKSRTVAPDGIFREHKFRELYLEGGANGDVDFNYAIDYTDFGLADEGVFNTDFSTTVEQWLAEGDGLQTDKWNEESDVWYSERSTGSYLDTLKAMKERINTRARGATITVTGMADTFVLLNKFGVGYRSRQDKAGE